MMDFSSVIDAGLVVAGVIAVLLMGLWTLSVESSTVSASDRPTKADHRGNYTLPKAA